jgi:hypothetical protein
MITGVLDGLFHVSHARGSDEVKWWIREVGQVQPSIDRARSMTEVRPT